MVQSAQPIHGNCIRQLFSAHYDFCLFALLRFSTHAHSRTYTHALTHTHAQLVTSLALANAFESLSSVPPSPTPPFAFVFAPATSSSACIRRSRLGLDSARLGSWAVHWLPAMAASAAPDQSRFLLSSQRLSSGRHPSPKQVALVSS